MYDLHSDRWSNISPLNFARDGPGVVSLNNSIYAAGGYNGKDYKVVERFDPRVGIWERVPNMEQSRSYGATAVADGKIFCFGGRQKDKKVVFVEFYDPRASKWDSLDDLDTEKSDARAVSIDNTIYLLGGLDKDDRPLDDVQSYDPLTREWMQLPNLTTKRRLMAVASVG
ncbi:kelch-like protein 12 [Bolinopsis microptera]|uniref:kelch-like protein 12 n=1 Tax=Bolinopsis microptera TaxID=2820187 RepID=UPI003079A3FB